MTRIRGIFVFSLFSVILGSSAASQSLFNEVYTDSNHQFLHSIVKVDTSIYSFNRNLVGSMSGTTRFRMERYDLDGTRLWDSIYFESDTMDSYNGVGTVSYSNGSFYVAGYQNYLDFRAIMMKVNLDGDTLFRKVMNTTDPCGFEDCVIGGNGAVFAGTYWDPVSDGDAFMVKCDTLGNVLWQSQFGGSLIDQILKVDTAGSDGYVMSGYTTSYGSGGADVYLVKVDTGGNFQWHKWYGSTGNDVGLVRSTSDGGFLIYGQHESTELNSYLIKLDSQGNTEWDTIYNLKSGFNDVFLGVIESTTNYVLIGGASHPTLPNQTSTFITSVSKQTGEMNWIRWYPGGTKDDSFRDIISDGADGFVIGGYALDTNSQTGWDPWLIHANCIGYDTLPIADFFGFNIGNNDVSFHNESRYAEEYIWDFGDGMQYAHLSNPADTMSSEPVVYHSYSSSGTYNVTLYAIACGDTSSHSTSIIADPNAIPEYESTLTIHCFPNPTKNSFELVVEHLATQVTLEVYDSQGKLIEQVSLIGSRTQINTDSWPAGFYMLKVVSESKVGYQRILKSK